MKISNELIETYLSLVNDKNPVHNEIVPGQLVCEIAFSELTFTGITIKLNISDPLIYMMIYVFVEDETKIKVSNNLDGVKLVILRI